MAPRGPGAVAGFHSQPVPGPAELSSPALLAVYIRNVYIFHMGDTAKIFQSGGSQAVRLPKAYRFEGQDEIEIRREGDRVILEPRKKSWRGDFLALAGSLPAFTLPPEPGPIDDAPEFD